MRPENRQKNERNKVRESWRENEKECAYVCESLVKASSAAVQ